MLRVMARAVHFFLHVRTADEQLGMGTLIDTSIKAGVPLGPEYADCTTANYWRRVVPPEER